MGFNLILVIILLKSTKFVICQYGIGGTPPQTTTDSFLLDPDIISCISNLNTTYGCDTTLMDICDNCNLSCTSCEEVPLTMQEEVACQLIVTLQNDSSCGETPHILDCDTFETVDKVKAIFNICFGVIGFVGNFLVLLVTIYFRKRSSRCQMLIGGLALLDLIFSAFQIAFHIPRLWTCRWLYGFGMCKVLHSTLNLSYMLAIGFIVLIAMERYVGIVHPLSRWLTNPTLLAFVAINIMLGLISISPSLYFLTLTKHSGGEESCTEIWPNEWSPIVYSWFLSIVYFLIPVLCITGMYYVIIKTLRKAVATQMYSINDHQLQKRHSENKRIMVILVSILAAAVVLVFPNRLSSLIMDHIGLDDIPKDTFKALTLFGFIPYSFHTAINPIIYSLVDIKFRRNVNNIFRCDSKRRRSSTAASSTNSFEMGSYSKRYSTSTG